MGTTSTPYAPLDDLDYDPAELIENALALLLSTTAGENIAEFLISNNVSIFIGYDDHPLTRKVNGSPVEIELSLDYGVDIDSISEGDIAALLALQLGHEGYHFMEPFGQDQSTLYEEWAAFNIENSVYEDLQSQGAMSNYLQGPEGFGPEDSFDPKNEAALRGWFSNNQKKYVDELNLPAYPIQYARRWKSMP